jgi:Ubiquitin-conjugating enzyme
MDHRLQRIENEWALLQRMAEANPASLVLKDRGADEFLLELRGTPAPVNNCDPLRFRREHKLRFSFGRFFPTMPIEAYLVHPVFHPNVHPVSGFVCLWDRSSVADTVIEALCQLQSVMTYTVFNDSSDHVMQPEALAWARDPTRGVSLPLACTPFSKPSGWKSERDFRKAPVRRRLSERRIS